MALDHVLPVNNCRGLSLPAEWIEDCTNLVLACAVCNGFDNRYRPTAAECPRSLEAVYALRGRIFAERKARIAERHRAERAFFAGRPWERRR